MIKLVSSTNFTSNNYKHLNKKGMKKKFTLFIASLFAVFYVQATENATFGWNLIGGGVKTDSPTGVATDANGNIYTAASFQLSATFNGITLTGAAKGSGANPDNNIFISKMSSTKTNLWNIYSNNGAVTPTSITVSTAGDLIVTGNMRAVINTAGQTTAANIIDAAGTITTFTGLGSAATSAQSFVAKFNANGIIQWVKEINSGTAKDNTVTTNALTTDNAGNVYVCGYFNATVVMPGTSTIITSTNTTQASFVAKLDGATGNSVWTKTSSGSILSENFSALTFGNDGYIYVAGIFRNNATAPIAVTIGTASFTPSSGYDIVLLKLNTDGTVVYVQDRSNTGDTRVKEILINGNSAFVGGSFRGDGTNSIKFTPTPLSSTAAYINGFIASFNTTTGADIWQKAVLAPAISEVLDLAIGYDNNLYATGYHYNALSTTVPAGPVVFGNGFELVDATNKMGDAFLTAYNASTGVIQEVHIVAKGDKADLVANICSSGENLYLLGKYGSTTLTFENAATATLTGGAAFDFFLANYKVSQTTGTQSISKNTPFVVVDKANKLIHIKNTESIATINLIDITGRLIKSEKTNGSNTDLSVQGLNTGVYLIQLTDKAGKATSLKFKY